MTAKQVKLIVAEVEKALMATYGLAKMVTPKQQEFLDLVAKNIKPIKFKENKNVVEDATGLEDATVKHTATNKISGTESGEDLH